MQYPILNSMQNGKQGKNSGMNKYDDHYLYN